MQPNAERVALPFNTSRAVIRIAVRWHDGANRRAQRVAANGGEPAPVPSLLDTTLAILMAMRNGCPLDLEAMLSATFDELDHDVGGLIQHVDRATGKVGGLFYPRMVKAVAA